MVQTNGKMCTIIVVWILWQILFLCPLVKADPATMECPSGRERTAEEWLIGADKYSLNVLKQVVGIGYAGDEENPRPLPKRTIVTFSLRAQRHIQQSGQIVFFSFLKDALKTSDPKAIPTGTQAFWCLVQPGGIILLSDGVTHHFTTVSHIDAKSGRIFFIDVWPDKFFLLKDHNTLGVEASVIDESPAVAFSKSPKPVKHHLDMLAIIGISGVSEKFKELKEISGPMPDWLTRKVKLVSITREEFERVIIGLSTPGSVQMLDYYLSLNPNLAKDFRVYRGFGLTALQAGNQFSTESANSLGKALALAKASGKRDEELFLASHQYLALVLTHYVRLGHGAGSSSASETVSELGALEKEYGGKALIKDYSSKDLVRLGNAAGRAGDLDRAMGWLDAAITTNSRDAAAYLKRSVAKLVMKSLDGTVDDVSTDDVSTAIRLLSQDEVAIRAKAATVDRRAKDEWQDVDADLTDVLTLKAQALQHRATVSLLTNKCTQATGDINELDRTLKLLQKEPTDDAKVTIISVQEQCLSK